MEPNFFNIKMIDQFKKIKPGRILVEIEVVKQNQKDLEWQHREGNLPKPVEPGDFSGWEGRDRLSNS